MKSTHNKFNKKTNSFWEVFVKLSSLNNTFLFVFKERELALKFFSTLSGVKTDKLDMVGQKLNHLERNCELSDSGKIKEALEALARFV